MVAWVQQYDKAWKLVVLDSISDTHHEIIKGAPQNENNQIVLNEFFMLLVVQFATNQKYLKMEKFVYRASNSLGI